MFNINDQQLEEMISSYKEIDLSQLSHNQPKFPDKDFWDVLVEGSSKIDDKIIYDVLR